MKIGVINFQDRLEIFTWQGYKVPDPQEMQYYDKIYRAETDLIVRTLNRQGVRDIYIGREMDEIKGSGGLFLITPHRPVGIMQLCHVQTRDKKLIFRMEINGMPCSEMSLCAAYAGAMGIPVLFVFGAEPYLQEAGRNLPGPFECVSSEINPASLAELRSPFSRVGLELAQKTEKALTHIGKTKPFQTGPVTVKFIFRYQGMMEKFCQFPFVKEQGDWLAIEATNAIEAWHLYRVASAGLDFWNLKISP
ncbi:MAG: M55 family metallopeptidase [Kiritimatiellaeota bacterium]|nr:M55 family metallopeptidase [Kiritimatiellota bacterium]